MSNRINIYGTIHIDVDCAKCGCSEEVEYDQYENSFLDGEWDVDVTIPNDEIKAQLRNHNWEQRNGEWICPDCAEP